ncbi:elongation factor P maturation arginine rhamnosyltransferase EarP [Pseudohongiella sp. O18]|uniref:elongation factor P maturation arginine rhamnosyltransferase EarP n=1 Tax=Pseudohongiella sp. O18 TaxID=2904248 RepID=UPI001F016E13|nr:elongation factor P maturation arginine rhamnosyltransferase EarP [Pseudohongiella sp. O18]
MFCRIIDNFGDIGVSWRLCQQLATEYGFVVTLWVDDWRAAMRFLDPLLGSEPDIASQALQLQGVCIRHWPEDEQSCVEAAQAAVIVEMFGCELPETTLRSMAAQQPHPCWINLEYLSAEDWVAELHGLPSPQTIQGADQTVTLQKQFFLPGFTDNTGGLLRERPLITQHQTWQNEQEVLRDKLNNAYGLDSNPSLWLSLFCYSGNSLANLVEALIQDAEPAVCIIPTGKLANQLASELGLSSEPAPGKYLTHGNIQFIVHPFVSQADYDRLLSICDINIVRGEDSFVRAQWAGKPLLWHIYPQDDGVHLDKLQAFQSLYAGEAGPAKSGAEAAALACWQALNFRWNCGDGIENLWHDLRPHLPALHSHARNWQQKLAELPDLTSSLVRATGFAT